jgi:3-hexulose-6-phosphate synthase/6-phospho-3-hexuloisomerase
MINAKPLIQVALDVLSLDDALNIASLVSPYVDVIEAGTPLIKSEGIRSVRELKKAHSDKLICADLKIADAGYLEVKMAASAGADIVTVLADAFNVTIVETLRAANEFNVKIMADLIMSRKPPVRLSEIVDLEYKKTKLHYCEVHSGLDLQEARYDPLAELASVVNIQGHPKIAIAGGINKNHIPKLGSYPIDVIIVGGAITRSKDPRMITQEIRALVDSTFS